MKRERGTIIELSDIKRVVFECTNTKCGAQIRTPFPDKKAPATQRCPASGGDWNGVRHHYYELLVELEKQLDANAHENATFRLCFEVAEDFRAQ